MSRHQEAIHSSLQSAYFPGVNHIGQLECFGSASEIAVVFLIFKSIDDLPRARRVTQILSCLDGDVTLFAVSNIIGRSRTLTYAIYYFAQREFIKAWTSEIDGC